MLHIRHRQVEPQLQLVVDGNRIVGPAVSFVVGTALALQNSRLSVRGSLKPPVKIGQCVGMICVLVQPGVLVDVVSGFVGVPVSGNGFQQVAHLQLVGIGFLGRLHTAFFDHPKLQRRCPGRYTENCRHIASADSVRNVAFGAMHPALQPSVIAHSGGVAQ